MDKVVLLYVVYSLLAVAVCVLVYNICAMRKAVKEIRTLLAEKLSCDTNTLITVSSGDKELCALADCLNKELSALRMQKHRFVNGDKELKEAVTNISHDLRTPLTAVCAYLELLEREEMSETATEYISAMKDRTEAMKALTEEMFRYCVILSEDQEPVLEKVSLTGVIEEALSGMYGAFTSRGITPQISMPEEVVYCIADKKMLLRVVVNILDNALKYSDGDLKIVLSENGKVQFSNTAKKLNNVDVGRLFDRFYTVDATRESTGLGLSIAKRLSERMGADISASYEKSELVITMQVACAKHISTFSSPS